MDLLPSVDLLRNRLVAHDMAIRQIVALDAYIARLSEETFASAMDEHLTSGFQNMMRISVAEGLKRMYKEYRLNKWMQVQEMAATVRRVLESGLEEEQSPQAPGMNTSIPPELQLERARQIEAEEVIAQMSNMSAIVADGDMSLNGFDPDVSDVDQNDSSLATEDYGIQVPAASSDETLDLSAILPDNASMDSGMIVSHMEQFLGAELYENDPLNTATTDISTSMTNAAGNTHISTVNTTTTESEPNISCPAKTDIQGNVVTTAVGDIHRDSLIQPTTEYGRTVNTNTTGPSITTSAAPVPLVMNLAQVNDNGHYAHGPNAAVVPTTDLSTPVLVSNTQPQIQQGMIEDTEANQYSESMVNMSVDSTMDWDDDSSYEDSLPSMLFAAQQILPEEQAMRLDVEMGDMGIGHVLFDRVSRTWSISHCEFFRGD